MNYPALLLTAITATSLAGCAATPHIREHPGVRYSFSNDKQEGIAFFSTTYSGECIPTGSMMLKSNHLQGNPKSDEWTIFVANPFIESDFPDHYALLHVRALPAGRYAIDDLVFFAYPVASYRTITRFTIPFSVQPGRATYLGRLRIHFTCDSTFRILATDAASEDFRLFSERTPKIPRETIITTIAAPRMQADDTTIPTK